jgi:uncharacterized protein involved in outer membrane biogenesis
MLCVLLYTIFGFLAAPLLAKMVLEKKLPPLLHRPVSIGKITLNPFSLRLAVENFHLGQKEGPGDLIAFDRLQVNLEATSLFRRALLIKAITLDGPRVEFSHLGEQTYSFSDLLEEKAEKTPEPPEKSKPFQFAIRNIEVHNGRISFHDLPKKTDHSVIDLNLGIPSLSNLPYQVETYVQPSFSAVINGTPFAVGGQSKPFAKSHETVVELKAKGIKLAEYLAYIPNPTGLVLESALLDVDANLHLLARPDSTYRVAVLGRVALRELAIADKEGRTWLNLPELAVNLADSDLLAREVHLLEVSFKSPSVKLERLADGRLLPVALLTPAEQLPKEQATAATGQESPGSLKVEIDKVQLTDGRVDFREAATGATVASRLEIDTSLHYLAQPDNPARLAVVGLVALRELALADKGGKNYLKLPELSVTLADSNLLAPELHLLEVNLQGPSLSLERLADGRLLPAALFATPPQGKTAQAATAEAAGKPEAATESPFRYVADRVVLNKGRVDFLDAAVAKGESTAPARQTVSDLTILIEALGNGPGTPATLALASSLNGPGRLRVRGQLGLAPFQGRFNLQLAGLALKPFQPYISEQARVTVVDGRLAAAGDLSLAPGADGGLKSDFTGQADLSQLALLDTVLGEDLLKWRNLGLKKIHFATDPGQLSIAEINLAGLYAKALIGKDGVMNLATLRPETPREEAQPPSAPASAAEGAASRPFATSIGNLVISDGRLDFEDRQISPAYGNSLGDLNGTITNLSSMTESSGEVLLTAKLDQQAPLKVTGRINPLRSDLLVDLKLDFTDANLSPLSPYSGKYIGYKLDKGKLNLDLTYNIQGRKLDSQNKIFIDQLTLGEEVESPEAANLPVNLALALLRDRNGGINLDLPVYGSLDDPDFSVGRIIIKVLLNLIAKAATSPMALLGALIPQGQDIQNIPFTAGQAELEPEAAAKLATVENVLYQRPALKMDLIGKVEPATDGEALARQHLARMVKLQKAKGAGKDVAKEGAATEVEVTPEEYPAFLAQAYQAARKGAPAPKAAAGPPPSVAEMESFLLSTIKVGEDELRLLALARANQVMATLTGTGKVEPGRLFVIEPKLGTAAAATQVELVLK